MNYSIHDMVKIKSNVPLEVPEFFLHPCCSTPDIRVYRGKFKEKEGLLPIGDNFYVKDGYLLHSYKTIYKKV